MGISTTPARQWLLHTVTVIGLLALCTPAHAQWKWRDKDGRVTASDRPPPQGVPDKDIITRPTAAKAATTRPAPAAPAASSVAARATAASAPADRELEARKKATEQERAAKQKADEERLAAQHADNCRRARAQLTALESGMLIARINDKGEREVLDDQGRADELKRTREVTASECR